VTGRRSLCLFLVASLAAEGGLARVALADPPTAASVKEAGKHFQRGVSLYSEADYRAALVEFRRAYEIAPNAAVLYNIGQAYFQLQNYAAALATFERYLAESGAAATHRHDVEQTLETLQSRVGKISVTTNVPDCDIAIDDEPAGRSPLAEPLPVSIGHRKITVTHAGRPPDTKFVDVAAGDTVQVSVTLAEPMVKPLASPSSPSAPESDGKGLITAGWVTTGVLGAGALTTGVLAFLASRDLKDLRNKFPATHDELASKSSRVSTLSAIADITGIAALVVGGITLKLSLSRSATHEAHVALTPTGVQVAGWFK
jgi:hypothetical protein